MKKNWKPKHKEIFTKKTLVFISIFTLMGTLFLIRSFAATPPPHASPKALSHESPVTPFVNEPNRGVNWSGLRSNPKGKCGRYTFEMVNSKGAVVGCTHGPDPAPDGVDVTQGYDTSMVTPQDSIGTTGVPCIGDGTSGSRVQMIYVYDNIQTNRINSLYPNFQTWAGQMQDEVLKSAQKTGGQRYIRFVTNSDCTLNVPAVGVSTADLSNLSNTETAISNLGYNKSGRKYVIWGDASIYCGIGEIISGGGADIPTTDNASNVFTLYARVDTGCWGRTDHLSELHELMHTLGAVQLSAPHSTTRDHCTDDYDVMCYNDGGLDINNNPITMSYPCSVPNPLGGNPQDTSPSSEWLLDCNNDDYFSTNPPPGSYLATHWNVANSSWLEPCLNGCTTTSGDINGDTHVNIYDFSILAANWSKTGQSRSAGDLSGDGKVDITDLTILAANFGT